MQTHHLKIEKTAKVCSLGKIENFDSVWIVLHGYGQLAQYFINNFKILKGNGIAVIAPEAQSRFYVNGFSGRVGATWMTKEERENDISDYSVYLNQVYDSFNLKNKKVTLLGFSQGGATAARWFSNNAQKFDQLILWSSLFPPDFDFESILKNLDSDKCKMVYGLQDPFITNEHYDQTEKIKSAYPKIEIITFDGEHKIDSKTLLKLI